MKWSQEAEKAISLVPFFVRKSVRTKVEEEATRVGARTVEMTHVERCRKGFLKDVSRELKGYRLETCFGASGCPNRIAPDPDLMAKLDIMLAAQDLKSFLKERVEGPLKIHHEYRVTVADCPNACSRPQISDVGIIAVQEPLVAGVSCSRCSSCLDTCAEAALSLTEHAAHPSIDAEKCLLCGQCVRVCESGTLVKGRDGYRLLLGGKAWAPSPVGKATGPRLRFNRNPGSGREMSKPL